MSTGFGLLAQNECFLFTHEEVNFVLSKLMYVKSLAPWGVGISLSIGLLVLSKKEN